MADQDPPPPTITAMKIPIIKKGEYDIWSMRMHQYICHTDHNLWDIIVNGDLQEEPAPTGDQSGPSAPPAPKTAKQLAAKRNQERVKSILLLVIPDEYLLKFYNVPDAKSLWEAIKSRFGGNEESKKMQKNVLKHQFENFTTGPNETLDKAYDRFQKLISQMEVYGAPVSKEDINQKFLRSLPPSWSQIDLIMRNKPDIDQVDIDDLYNNLRVYEDEMKKSSSSTSTQNLAFLSSENTSSTNEVSTASGNFGVSTSEGTNQGSSTPCAHEVACSFFDQPTNSPQLENEDFLQIDGDDLEELDLRWQLSATTVTKGHFARECRSRRNQGRRPYSDNGRNNAPTNESSSQELVAQDGLGGYDWINDFEVEPVNYALMAISSSSSSSSSDKEVQNCSKQCVESFKSLQKNLDNEREKHSRARLEIQGYKLALESLESRILNHEKNELAWGEKYDQMSARDQIGLGYGTQLNELSSTSETDSEISLSVFYVSSSDAENTPENDRFSKDGFHAVPPPITGNFLTPRADISFAGLDECAIRNKIIESTTTGSKIKETLGKTNVVNTEKPKSTCKSVMSNSKINKVKVIIEDWTSDDEDEGIGFKKVKACFVCKSTDHLIKDCNFHDKRSQEPKKKNVVKTGQRVDKPVWDNAKRVNHQNFSNNLKYPHLRETFIPSGVLTRTGLVHTTRPSVNSVRPVNYARSVSTTRSFVPKIAPTSNAIRPIYPRMDNVRPRASCLPVFRPKNLKQDVKTSGVKHMPTVGTSAVVNAGKGKMGSKWVWNPKGTYIDHVSKESGSFILKKFEYANPQGISKSTVAWDHAVVDSGCSSHMTGNKAYLSYYKDYNGDFVAFGSDPKRGQITGKGKIKTANLDFDDVYFVDELKFNLFSVSQMCDKKNSVLFIETEYLIMSPSFKLLDESQVVLRAPRKDDVYNLDLKNIVPSGGLENQLNHKVKIIRCDNGTKFKNHTMNEFCAKKGIKREFSVARTPQQNGVAERKNRTLIEAARIMLAYSLLPIPFWAEAVNTACYVLNSKAFRVYNKRTKRVEENLHIDFLEDQPNVAGKGPDWMFDLDFLTNSMNYIPVSIENQVTVDAGTQESYVAGSSGKDKEPSQEYILLPLHPHRTRSSVEAFVQDAQETPFEKASKDKNVQDLEDVADKEEQHQVSDVEQALHDELENMVAQEVAAHATSTNTLSTGRPFVSTPNTNSAASTSIEDDSDALPTAGIFNGAYDDEDVGAEADFTNMDNTIDVNPIPTLRIYKVHPKDQILGDPKSAIQTRGKIQKASSAQQALENQTTGGYQFLVKSNLLAMHEAEIVENSLLRTKHIEIRFHFIRDCYEKRRIEVVKIHTGKSLDLKMNGICASYFSHIWVHNMVGFLKKPDESVGFAEAVDFLKGTSLNYALTHNPTVYDSLVKQFWQTATVRTLANGNQQLEASIDNKPYTITEASFISKLQLADAAGISNLPDADIYAGLETLGCSTRSRSPPRQEPKIPQSQDPTPTFEADDATTTGVEVETKGATITTSGLDTRLDSGNIYESPLKSHETPPQEGHTSRSVKDSVKLQELMVLVPKLESKIDNLEKELKETKQTLGSAIRTLAKKVKSLEVELKRKTKKVVVSDTKDEEIEAQERKIQELYDDPLVSLVKGFVTPIKTTVSAIGEEQVKDISPITLEAAKTLSKVASQKPKSVDKGRRYKKRKVSKGKDISTGLDVEVEVNSGNEDFNTGFEEVNPGSIGVSTSTEPVSTPSAVQTTIPSPVKGQREGKAPMTAEEIQATKKTKEQIQQEEAGLAEAIRLQTQQEEEAARHVYLDELLAKRIQEEQELSEQQEKRKA
ncbi:ribonuclease H-like domain-containing protein [Tanacetum coccineum]